MLDVIKRVADADSSDPGRIFGLGVNVQPRSNVTFQGWTVQGPQRVDRPSDIWRHGDWIHKDDDRPAHIRSRFVIALDAKKLDLFDVFGRIRDIPALTDVSYVDISVKVDSSDTRPWGSVLKSYLGFVDKSLQTLVYAGIGLPDFLASTANIPSFPSLERLYYSRRLCIVVHARSKRCKLSCKEPVDVLVNLQRNRAGLGVPLKWVAMVENNLAPVEEAELAKVIPEVVQLPRQSRDHRWRF